MLNGGTSSLWFEEAQRAVALAADKPLEFQEQALRAYKDHSKAEASDRLQCILDNTSSIRKADGQHIMAMAAIEQRAIPLPATPAAEVELEEAPEGEELVDLREHPAFSDEALSLRFAERHAHHLRYVAAWNRWLRYDGARWAVDDTVLAFDLARAVCRQAASECPKKNESLRRSVASAQKVNAVIQLARSDRRLAAKIDQWDADPWTINCPGGVIDLRSGAIRPHTPMDYMTKITAVSPGGDCPLWRRFLARITGGDEQLQAFLQRLSGYALTGITREHVLGFGHGHGANGKSVFMSTVSGVMKDYHRSAPIDTFIASKSSRHETDLASLQGARLVTAIETEEGRRWAEAKIKMLTGGERVAARFMRQDFFEYTPQFKLLIAGNHKPGLRSVDEAMRRRVLLIPFSVTIPPSERDLDLTEKLRAEWPGIIAWMIEGCLEWQRIGLAPPEAVRAATDDYLASEDVFSAWLDEYCERVTSAWTRAIDLFESWKAYAERVGEDVGTIKVFKAQLEAHGFVHKNQAVTKRAGHSGLRLLLPDTPPKGQML